MRNILLICIIILCSLPGLAQVKVPVFGSVHYLKGYVKEISGENLAYHSALPDIANLALLTRCTDGNYSIEWETEAVPPDSRGKYIYFAWLAAHSTKTSHGNRNFTLWINDRNLLTFKTLQDWKGDYWSAEGQEGVALVFDHQMDDGAGDAHGYMYLRVPIGILEPGKPLRLKVAGEAANSRDWYMTFKYAFGETVRLHPVSFISNDDRQPIQVLATHFGKEKSIQFIVDGKEKFKFLLQPGLNNFEIFHPAVDTITPVTVKVQVEGAAAVSYDLILKPVKFREIFLIHHSHYDVGYSHHQLEVERIQNQNIANALRYIERTRDYPEPARYRWNIETTMAIDNFLKIATADQKIKLEKAVCEGQIGIGAMYANLMMGICQPEELFKLTDYACQLEKEWDIRIPAAMISDIPGLTWATAPALARTGVRYFSSGPNYTGALPYEGDRVGFSNLSWKDRPFWWVSPSGNEKILYWMAGKGYSSWHGFKPGEIGSVRGRKRLSSYLDELDQQGYPYEMVQMRYNIIADNGPTDSLVADFVRDWNLQYRSPKIRLSTIDAMFREFETRYGQDLPSFSGDMTPYWEDGAYSTASEMTMNRRNSERLTALSALWALSKPEKYPSELFSEAWRKILLWDEHTWGAYNSISDPDIPFVTSQWDFKKQYALDADSLVQLLQTGLSGLPDPAKMDQYDVYNVSSWTRTDVVYFDEQASALVSGVINQNDEALPFQRLSDGRMVVQLTIPPLSYSRITIHRDGKALNFIPVPSKDASVENTIYRIGCDRSTGSINSLIVKEDKLELVDSRQFSGLNEYIYVAGRDPGKYGTASNSAAFLKENGPVLSTLRLDSEAPGCNTLSREITLYNNLERIEIRNTLDKKAVREKESVHFAFPFNISSARERFNTGWGGIFEPGINQLAGSNQDYYSVNHWCDVSNQQVGVTLLLREACLVEPGAMISEVPGKFGVKEWKTLPDTSPTLFSYVMNNYWHTNFMIDQEGPVTYTYALVPHRLFNVGEAYRQGMEFNQPFISLPAGDKQIPEPLFTLQDKKVLLTMLEPIDGGYKMRLFNAGGAPTSCAIQWRGSKEGVMKVSQVAGQEVLQNLKEPIFFPAFGIAEVEITQ